MASSDLIHSVNYLLSPNLCPRWNCHAQKIDCPLTSLPWIPQSRCFPTFCSLLSAPSRRSWVTLLPPPGLSLGQDFSFSSLWGHYVSFIPSKSPPTFSSSSMWSKRFPGPTTLPGQYCFLEKTARGSLGHSGRSWCHCHYHYHPHDHHHHHHPISSSLRVWPRRISYKPHMDMGNELCRVGRMGWAG